MQAEPLQQHDEWDATPLYYAAYAGNQDLVSYLLSTGAKCEEKARIYNCTVLNTDFMSTSVTCSTGTVGMWFLLQTFDGERCLYAALNDATRHLLLDEGFKRAGDTCSTLTCSVVPRPFVTMTQ